jgi:hypothetical protein
VGRGAACSTCVPLPAWPWVWVRGAPQRKSFGWGVEQVNGQEAAGKTAKGRALSIGAMVR